MTQGLADTSLFIARETGRPIATETLPDQLAVSVITIGELRAGVLSATDSGIRDRRLSTLLAALAVDPIPVDGEVAEAWAILGVSLHQAGRRMPVNDSWIAATALSLGVPVVTQDDDYRDVPKLTVIKV